MTRLRIALLIAAAALLAAPAFATCPSNPAVVACTGGPVAIPDDAYDGTTGSMACLTCTYTIDAGCPDVLKTPPVFDIAVTHTWVGDLVIKVINPGGLVKRIQSRAAFSETADDGLGCCGDSDDWTGATVTYTEEGTGNPPSEDMGVPGGIICTGDGICAHDVNQGLGFPGTDDDLSDYVGPAAAGAWMVCVGDAGSGDTGTLDSASITFEQVPVELQSFAVE
ncbi:MAG: hypothetical protein GY719_08350 [bacterium]|nr:hypothetical protein [bacterium]